MQSHGRAHQLPTSAERRSIIPTCLTANEYGEPQLGAMTTPIVYQRLLGNPRHDPDVRGTCHMARIVSACLDDTFSHEAKLDHGSDKARPRRHAMQLSLRYGAGTSCTVPGAMLRVHRCACVTRLQSPRALLLVQVSQWCPALHPHLSSHWAASNSLHLHTSQVGKHQALHPYGPPLPPEATTAA